MRFNPYTFTGLVLGALVGSILFVPAFTRPTPAAPLEGPQTTSVYLQFAQTACSGTVVGPSTILTSTHCLTRGPLVSINDQPAKALHAEHDGRDHSLLTVTTTYERYATLHPRWLAQGEEVHYIGNPANYRDLYREGDVMGFCDVPAACLDGLADSTPNVYIDGTRAVLLDVEGFLGDSGAGVFDAEGYLVTTVSAIVEVAPTMYPMVAFDMQFTPEQLEAIR